MQLLLYMKSTSELRSSLRRLINDFVPEAHVEEYQDIEPLRKRLLMPKTVPLIAVIAPLDSDEFGQVLSLDFLLDDLKVILILPDRREETIRQGHLLRPRFLTFADDQLVWVVEVIKKMIGQHERLGAVTGS